MATGNTRDVNLVIRARSEAERAFKQSAEAADQFGSGIAQLEGKLKALEGTENRTVKTLRDVTAGLDTQAQKLSTTSQTVQQYRAKIAELTTAIDKLKRESVAEGFTGDVAKATAQIKTMEREVTSLQNKLNGTDKRPGGLEAQLTKELEGYRQLRQAQITLRESQKSVDAAILNTTRAIIDQDNALKALNATARQKSNAQALNATIARSTNSVSGKSAEASAAVFEAGFSSNSPKLINDAAAAHAAFEARVKQGAAEMRAAAAAAASESAQISQLRNTLNPAAAATQHMGEEVRKLYGWMKSGKITMTEYRGAVKLLKQDLDGVRATSKKASDTLLDSRGRPALFGLKPYELQNLSFQINDVFTQLASGTSLTQTLAQQGGQIFQLFPRVGNAVAAGLTSAPILAFVAAMGTLVLAVSNASDKAEKLRELNGILTLNADGARTTAQALLGTAKSLDRYGMSAEEALALTKQFLKDGLNPAQIELFGRTARDLSDLMGTDLKDAANEVSEAFRGGFDAIEKLDRQYNFLTASQREQIRTLFDQGRATEATTLAMQIFSKEVGDAADKARGPWAEAFRELGNAWSDMTDSLGDTDWAKALTSSLADVGRSLGRTIRDIRGAQTLADIELKLADLKSAPVGSNPQSQRFRELQIQELEAKRNRLEEEAFRRRVVEAQAQQAAATERQTKANARLTEDTARRAVAEQKITSEKAVQFKLEQVRKDALAEAASKAPDSTDEARQAFADARVEAERVRLNAQLTDYRKQQAEEAKRERKERERISELTKFRDPVDGPVTSGFGPRKSPGGVGSTFHQGMDYGVPVGTSVRAPAVGVVEAIGYDKKLGKYVVIDHGNNVKTKYGHLSVNDVRSVGDRVEAGDLIAKSGNTGTASTGAHLHYTLTVNGKPVDPTKGLFPADGQGLFKIDQADAGSDLAKELERAQQKQDEYNAALDAQMAKRRMDTEQLESQRNLVGEALIDAEKRAAVEDAIAKAVAEATKAGVDTESPEFKQRVELLRQVETGYYNVARAKDVAASRRDAIDKPVAELTALRDSLQRQIAEYQQTGQTGLANNLQAQLDTVNSQLDTAIAKAREFYASLEPGNNPYGLTRAALDDILLKLDVAKAQTQQWGYFMGISGQQIAQTFASTATSAIDKFSQAVANGQNVFSSLWDAFRQFAADFLRQIAQMIIQQLIFNAVSGLLGGGGGGFGSAGPAIGAGSSLGGGLGGLLGKIFHGGGVVGDASTYGAGSGTALVNPAWFANARRYHTGGIAGLQPNEVPAILQKGEEVLTASDPRHRANGGGSAAAPNIKIVNAIDGGEMISQALNTKVGEKAILNFMRQNASAVRGALG